MFDEENLISLAIFLSFCLFVHNTFVQPWLWGYVFFSKFLCFLHNFHFFREIFVLFFREIFAIFFSRNFWIFYFAKISHFLFSGNFRVFRAQNGRKIFFFSKKNVSRKMRNFRESIFFFSLETLVSNCLLVYSKRINVFQIVYLSIPREPMCSKLSTCLFQEN